MWLLVDYNNNITRLFIGMLIWFTMEYIFLSMRRTFVNNCLDDLLFLENFLAIACLTFVGFIDLLTGSIAISTRSCWLGIHSWTEHGHLCYHSATFASSTSWVCSVHTSFTITFLANSISVDRYLRGLTLVDVFECDFNSVLDRLAFLWSAFSSTHTASEHLREDIAVRTHSSTALFDSVFAILVVDITLFFVAKNVICCSERLEFFWITSFIRVFLQSLLPIRFSYFWFLSFFINSQELIIFVIINLLLRSSWTAWHSSTMHILELFKWETTSEHLSTYFSKFKFNYMMF